jgi:hypothetical protein
MEKAISFILINMNITMTDFGKTIWNMAMVPIIMPMKTNIKENGNMVIEVVKEFFNMLAEPNMKDN